MANPPYSGTVLILKENADGINARAYHWTDVAAGTPIPPNVNGLEHQLFRGAPTTSIERMTATRTALKTAFGQFVDVNFSDTPA